MKSTDHFSARALVILALAAISLLVVGCSKKTPATLKAEDVSSIFVICDHTKGYLEASKHRAIVEFLNSSTKYEGPTGAWVISTTMIIKCGRNKYELNVFEPADGTPLFSFQEVSYLGPNSFLHDLVHEFAKKNQADSPPPAGTD